MFSWSNFSTLFLRFVLAGSLGVLACQTFAQTLPAHWTLSQKSQQPLSPVVSIYRHTGPSLTLKQLQTLEKLQALEKEQIFQQPDGTAMAATNFGLTTDEIWLRLHFLTPAAIPERWLLEVANAHLDHLDFYLLQEGQLQTHQQAGDLIAFQERPFQHRHPVFDFSLQPEKRYTFYLRVTSQGTLSVPVILWQPSALWQKDQLSYSLLSAYYGVLAALLIYNLFLFVSLRDRLYLVYVAFISSLALGQAGLSGFAGQFLWPETPYLAHLSPTAGVSAAGLFGALFVQGFLGRTVDRLRMGWLMPLFSLGYAAILLTVLAGFYHYAALAVNLLSLAFSLSAFLLGGCSLYYRQAGARFFVLAWVALLTGVLVISLHNLGILPSNDWTANSLLIGSALEMLLLSLALADRINLMQKARDAAQAQSIKLRQEMVEALEKSEQKLEQRVAERTLALEEANQALQQSHQLLEYQAHHDSLTGLANRKYLQQAFIQVQAQAEIRQTGFAVLVVDLNKFKQINDTWGHQAGDEVLVALAQRLQQALTPESTLARVGGDEFVILVPGCQTPETAEALCTELIQAAVQPLVLSQGATVLPGMSLGYAFYPQDAQAMDDLLHQADQAMYQQKQSLRADL